MAEYYDGGNVYKFMHRIDALDVSYQEKAVIFHDRTEKLLAAAGLSRTTQTLKTVWFFILGAREHDLHAHLQKTVDESASREVLRFQLPNAVANEIGRDAFLEYYNNGRRPVFFAGEPFIRSVLAFPLASVYSFITKTTSGA